jgi:hypothetical protein
MPTAFVHSTMWFHSVVWAASVAFLGLVAMVTFGNLHATETEGQIRAGCIMTGGTVITRSDYRSDCIRTSVRSSGRGMFAI